MRITAKAIRNEKGVALMMVLVLSVIMLGIMAALVYMLVASTQVSGIQKRYKTALDAGKGGVDLTFDVIANRGTLTLDPAFITYTLATVGPCLDAKMNLKTSDWGVCDAISRTPTIDITDLKGYDLFVDNLGTAEQYQIYAKIVDTVEGNSGADIGLQKAGVVTSNTGEVQAMSKPYLYSIEVQAQNKANPAERAQYSVLYQY